MLSEASRPHQVHPTIDETAPREKLCRNLVHHEVYARHQSREIDSLVAYGPLHDDRL